MKRAKFASLILSGILVVAGALGTVEKADAQGEFVPGTRHPWNVGVTVGSLGFEGDEEVQDGIIVQFHGGYDYTDWWTFEGTLLIAPQLDENMVGETTLGANGVTRFQKISLLERSAGAGVHDASGIGLSGDALLHFTRHPKRFKSWERFDPYLAVGVGMMFYSEDLGENSSDPAFRVGCGVMYHLNDQLGVRADIRTFLAGEDTEANMIVSAGLRYTIGAGVPEEIILQDGNDMDNDGLTDDDEDNRYGTDKTNPDTDGDGLWDGEEVNDRGTDPLKVDTDLDMLGDGDEVYTHKTNPLEVDTDNGGVSDGHEILDDRTDPLNGADDLQLFTLYIKFETKKWEIRPEYYNQLDVIGKVLARDPGATAVIEGHADKRKRSEKEYNQKLSERRAGAVLNYLVDAAGIERKRMKAVGCGFDRPLAENDPEDGNELNRRVEIYVRKSGEVPDLEEPIVLPDPKVPEPK